MQEIHCPLPPDNEALHCKTGITHYPQALWQSTAAAAVPTAPR